ncbi:MAG: hypothetical protein NZT61_07735, partial [Deltaproteobacteria bacterium]|nr:hypothetical protein [Deltaproteobacteria bacterium]
MKPGTRLEQKSVCSDQVTIVKKLSCSLLRIGRALFALSGLVRLSVEKASEVKNKMGFALKAGKLRRNLMMSH